MSQCLCFRIKSHLQQGKAGTLDPQRNSVCVCVCVGGGGVGLPRSTQGTSKLKILAHAGSFHRPLAAPTASSSHTWLGSACWQHWPSRNRLFLQCIYHYTLIKEAARRKTFLCSVAAQMFHKVVPTEAGVRTQPACPHRDCFHLSMAEMGKIQGK